MSAPQIRLAALLAALAILAAPLVVSTFAVTLLNYIGVYALVAIGLVLLTGVGGVVSFGQAAFVGLGAYATAWATTTGGVSPWLGLMLALAVDLRRRRLAIGLRDDAAEGASSVARARSPGGSRSRSASATSTGSAISPASPSIPADFDRPASRSSRSGRIYYLIWLIVIAALVLVHNLLDFARRAARCARCAAAISWSRASASTPFRIRLTAFVIAALLCALSGWLYAHLEPLRQPLARSAPTWGIEYLMMAMVGGAASPIGGVVGAAVISILKNAIQDYLPLIAKGAAGQLEIVVFSALFILFLQRARDGVDAVPGELPAEGRRRERPAPAPAAAAPRAAAAGNAAADAAIGAAPLQRTGRRQRSQLRGQGRRDPRPDRPQRRGQDRRCST